MEGWVDVALRARDLVNQLAVDGSLLNYRHNLVASPDLEQSRILLLVEQISIYFRRERISKIREQQASVGVAYRNPDTSERWWMGVGAMDREDGFAAQASAFPATRR